jgi:GT2 family glycosyltransferase
MKDLQILVPSYKGEPYLDVFLTKMKESLSVDAEIILILNEVHLDDSYNIARKHGVKIIASDKNYGTQAVDLAMPILNSKYVSNVNTDMIFHKGWDLDILNIIEKNYPCTASCSLVEPEDTGNPVVIYDDLGPFSFESADLFLEKVRKNHYIFNDMVSYNHPITVLTEDFIKTNGYSNGFDEAFWPGYGNDDVWPYRLLKLNPDYKFISSGMSFVYHAISGTMKKLDPSAKARNGWNSFIRECGMDIHSFKRQIGSFKKIEIKR